MAEAEEGAQFVLVMTTSDNSNGLERGDFYGGYVYDNPIAAAEQSKALNAHWKRSCYDDRVKVKKLSLKTLDWREREAARFASGEYTPVPWANTKWGQELNAQHFTHVSKKRPGSVAYTPDGLYGAVDRKRSTCPWTYLTTFAPVEHSTKVRYACQAIEQFGTVSLAFAMTPDEIEHVYVNGPRSCMSGTRGEYEGPEHPVRAYGAGDLAIAYLRREDKGIAARVLCWPEKKVYATVYGDGGLYSHLLADKLNKEGYEQNHGGFYKAKLRRIPCATRGGFVAPYFDIAGTLKDKGDHLLIVHHGDLGVPDAAGMLADDDTVTCAGCGDRHHVDDNFVGGANDYCEACFFENFFYCDCCGEPEDRDTASDRRDMTLCPLCLESILEEERIEAERIAVEEAEQDRLFQEEEAKANAIDDEVPF